MQLRYDQIQKEIWWLKNSLGGLQERIKDAKTEKELIDLNYTYEQTIDEIAMLEEAADEL